MSIPIDIVARDADAVVFIELKARRDRRVGPPTDAVVADKRARQRRLAATWLNGQPIHAEEIRSDVVSLLRPPRGPALIEHVRAAF